MNMTINEDDKYIVADNKCYYPSVIGYKTKKEAEKVYIEELKYREDYTVVIARIIRKSKT